MNTSTPEFDGVLLIDKPEGLTSHDVVDRVRHKLRMKRVGHAGTLDPMATGLLIILAGKATKISQYLMSLDKVYEGTAKLGESTDSHDRDGEIVERRAVPPVDADHLREVLQQFVGDQYQIPPMFSAKKMGGVPLYKLARKGQTVEREPRFIHIYQFELLRWESPELDFRVGCSKGTYVRTLVHDVGHRIGCGAHLISLRRTAIERFQIGNAVSLAALEGMSTLQIQRALIPIYQAVPSHVL